MTTDHPTIATVLRIADEGGTVDAMCEVSGLKSSRVYAVLRKHRPDRPRQPRRRVSRVPDKVRGLTAAGIAAPRVAFLLGITPAYVYAILGREKG